MKKKISITIEEATLEEVARHVDSGTYRNKSHFIELAVNKKIKDILNTREEGNE
jgi:Arc/MetJ-type ribon-helix-helix transcriptional regulator